ncbi:MAG: helix-turn-helix domain-containing protein [Bacteroidales bacterium]|nr:helix-turn-helix domain-containing protein [Candidatus Equimonas faecalis]
MANNNDNTMGQLVVMTRADLDSLLQDAIAASRSLVPEPVKEEALPSMADEYVTRQQAAKILHLDVSSLWRLEKAGRLVPFRASGRRVLYRKTDLEANPIVGTIMFISPASPLHTKCNLNPWYHPMDPFCLPPLNFH